MPQNPSCSRAFVALRTLEPGSAFETESGRRGILLYANDCRARVRFGEAGRKTITKTDPGGQNRRTFQVTTPAAELDIAPNTAVLPVEA